MRGQEVAQRVDRDVQLGAAAALGAVVAGAVPALGRGLERAAVEDHGRGPRPAAGEVAQQAAEVGHHRLEHAGFEPPHRLLVDDLPGREVMGQPAPGGPGPHGPLERVEHLPEIMPALHGVSGQQGEVRGDEGPLLVAHIGGVWLLASGLHARDVSTPPLPNTL